MSFHRLEMIYSRKKLTESHQHLKNDQGPLIELPGTNCYNHLTGTYKSVYVPDLYVRIVLTAFKCRTSIACLSTILFSLHSLSAGQWHVAVIFTASKLFWK